MDNQITPQVIQQFTEIAPELQHYISQVDLELIPTNHPPSQQLVRSIIFQQLSGSAANAIFNRFSQLVGDTFTPDHLLQFDQDQFREVGISKQKSQYIQNVSNAFSENGNLSELDSISQLKNMNNQSIIDKFTQIKGIGIWTVQMYLIFGLGRLNIIASTDLGVRKGVEIMYELEDTPSSSKVREMSTHWQPLGTIGSLLCWRIQD